MRPRDRAFGAVYLILAVLAWATRSLGPLVRAKMLVGGLIVSLSAATTATAYAGTTCYERAPLPETSIRFLPPAEDLDNGAVVDPRNGSEILVVAENAKNTELFYELVRDGKAALQGPIQPLDGRMDTTSERARISLDPVPVADGCRARCSHRGRRLVGTRGNIFDARIDDLLDSEYVRRFHAIVPARCGGCPRFARCQGGCKAACEQLGLPLERGDPMLADASPDASAAP